MPKHLLQPPDEVVRSFLDWSGNKGIDYPLISEVAEWLTSGMRAETGYFVLQEWLASQGPVPDHVRYVSAAEALLLRLGVQPVSTLSRAADIIADAAAMNHDLTLLVDDALDDFADHHLGLRELIGTHGRIGFRNAVRPKLQRALQVRRITAPLTAESILGYEKLLDCVVEHTSSEVLLRANAALCGMHHAKGLGRWLHAQLEHTDPGTASAMSDFCRSFGADMRGPVHLWMPSWTVVHRVLRLRRDGIGVAYQGAFDFDVAGEPNVSDEERWLDTLLFFGSDNATYYNRRDVVHGRNLGHGRIFSVVHDALRDESGLPHSSLSKKENLNRLRMLVSAQVSATCVSDRRLAPLAKLIGSKVKVSSTKNQMTRPVTQVSHVAVVRALRAFSDEWGFVPSPQDLESDIGFSVAEIEATFGLPYERICTKKLKGIVSPVIGKPKKMSSLEWYGQVLLMEAFGTDVRTEVYLKDQLECCPTKWALCRIDAVTDVDFDGTATELWNEFDGPQHTKAVKHWASSVDKAQKADQSRHDQLRQRRSEGVDARLVSYHYKTFSGKAPLVTSENLAEVVAPALAAGWTWVYVRPTGCSEPLRGHRGRAVRFDAGFPGIEMWVTDNVADEVVGTAAA